MSVRTFLVLAAGIALFSTQNALAATDLIWDNQRGFLPTTGCSITAKDSTVFRVSQRSGSGSGSKAYENLRQHDGTIRSYLLDGSVVKLIPSASKPEYQAVEVVGVSPNPRAKNPKGLSKRLDRGYLHEKSLLSPTDFVFEILDEAPAAYIGESRAKLPGSFWQVSMQGQQLLYAVCRDGQTERDYLMFDVFIVERKEPLARVGVYFDETNIFRSIRTYDPDEAEAKIDALLKSMDLRGGGQDVSNIPVPTPAPPREGEVKTREDDETRLSQEEIDINEETGETGEDDDENALHPDAGKPTELPPVQVGDSSYVTCFDDGSLQVRDATLNKVLFTVGRHETVKFVQAWTQVNKVRRVNGRDVKYVEVQFPDRSGQPTGWVAESFVLGRTLCPSYQAQTGTKQTIVCTDSGSVRVRGQDLKTVMFSATQFEAVSLWTGSNGSAKPVQIDGKTYELIPVVFPERRNATGWIPREFVKEKAQCEPFNKAPADVRAQQATGINSGTCCVFPTIKRPTHSYLSGMRRFRAGRSKGRRLHAACDLYRVHGEAAVAVAPGKVIRNKYYFYQGTYALEVKHTGGFVVRYGEITGKSVSGVSGGKPIKAGQTIGYIGTVNSGCCRPMLHFEMYSGKKSGALSVRGNSFQRRSDLVDPTRDLRKWEQAKFGASY